MLKQATDIRTEEEIRSTVGSSLANIGLDPMARHYDAVTGNPVCAVSASGTDDKLSEVDPEKTEGTQDNKLMDGDETPKVSRVSTLIEIMLRLIQSYHFSNYQYVELMHS